MTKQELAAPPTEPESAYVIQRLTALNLMTSANVVRRLVYQRDMLSAENAVLRRDLSAAKHKLHEE